MSKYEDLEINFIERTMELIEQYNHESEKYPFEKQYNHTLLLNCMLGLIVMPKEKVITYVPNDRLTSEFKKGIGLTDSYIHDDIKTLRELIQRLRNSIAHFNINVISEDNKNRIDLIEFIDSENGNKTIARFREPEILPFLQHYSVRLLTNIKKNK